MRQKLTYDQGKEMSRHAELTANTGINAHFCDPRSPRQRGTWENINDLICLYMHKGADLSDHSLEQLVAIVDQASRRVLSKGFIRRLTFTGPC